MSDPSAYRVEVFRGPEGLERLAPDWRRLTGAMSRKSFFHLVEWHQCYLDALEPDPEALLFCAVYRADEPVAILPLRRARRTLHGSRVRVLEVPQHPHLPLCDLVLRSPGEAGALLPEALRQLHEMPGLGWDVLRIHNVREDASVVEAIEGSPLRRVRELTAYSDALPVQPVSEVYASFSGNFRSNLNKARNKLARLDETAFVTVRQPAELEAALQEFLVVEGSGWKGERGSGTAIRLQERLIAFYRLVLERFAALGVCQVNLLRHGTRPIAGQITLDVGGTCTLLKMGFDEEYAAVAPGNQLLLRLLEACGERPGVGDVDLVSGASWHHDWKTVRRREMYRITLFNRTPAGVAAHALLTMRERARPVFRTYVRPLLARVRPAAAADPRGRRPRPVADAPATATRS